MHTSLPGRGEFRLVVYDRALNRSDPKVSMLR